ncbi:MAG: glycosyltransferase family 4 protein [Chitinophagales bacterium]|nr:glycosyltransferase family 4 protein [Chitinophagales bacterium]HQO90024.1 glycosyltransferase family 1 protein [Chitinophagales bacterium]
MIIGFDGKRLYDNKTGLGNYSRTLMHRLLNFYPENEYKIFVHQKYFEDSPYKYTDFVERTVISEAFSADLWRFRGVEDDIIRQGVQVYHGLSNEVPELPATVKKVVTIHDVIFHKLPKTFPFIDRQMYAYKTKKACHIADAIIAVSEQTKQDLIELTKTPEEKIHVVYPTWNKEYEHECNYVLKEEYFNRYGLPRDFVLFVGAVSKRKNFLRLLEAMALPENKDKNLVAVSNGGDEYDEAERLIYEKGLEGNVFFLKDLPWYELPIIYHMSQGLVYPSIYEGFGLPILEALRCGKPVITSNVSSMPEVGGDACIFIDPANVEEISAAINFIYYNLELAAEIREKAMHQVQKFAPEKMTAQMMQVYQSL